MGEYYKRVIVRQFAQGNFRGQVVDYDSATGFRILYEDGDTEDLKEAKLLELLAKTKRSKVVDGSEATPEEPVRSALPHADASRTTEQYLAAVRGVAKRKRRHTAMKRAGLLVKKVSKPKVAAEETPRMPLHKPPEWAHGISREGRAVRLDCSSDEFLRASFAATNAADGPNPADGTFYSLELHAESPHALVVRWNYPAGNPGSNNAWVGLCEASEVEWHAEHGEVPAFSAAVSPTCQQSKSPFSPDTTGVLFCAQGAALGR